MKNEKKERPEPSQYSANVSLAGKITPRSELYESLSWLPRTSGSDVGSALVIGSSSNLESEETMCRRPRYICNRPGLIN